jgi:type IV pilus assembly protein PilE
MIDYLKRISAVTLMELIVVVAIIAIMAGIGYPSYVHVQQQVRRSDAQSAVLATVAIVQRYLGENNKANIDSTDMTLTEFANYSPSSGTPVVSSGGYYVITIVPDSTSYTVNATATAAGALDDCSSNPTFAQCADTTCRVISIADGLKQSTSSTGSVANAAATTCW